MVKKIAHWIFSKRTLCGLIIATSISEEPKTFGAKQSWVWPSREGCCTVLNVCNSSSITWCNIPKDMNFYHYCCGNPKISHFKYSHRWLLWSHVLCCRSPNSSLSLLMFDIAYFSPHCVLYLCCSAAAHRWIYTTSFANPQGLQSRGGHGISPTCLLNLLGNILSQ
jgi:hypothetical protein